MEIHRHFPVDNSSQGSKNYSLRSLKDNFADSFLRPFREIL